MNRRKVCLSSFFFFMIAFSLGNIHIYWYGIFYVVAIVFAYFFFGYLKIFSFLRDIAPRFYHVLSTAKEDLLVYAVVGVLLGGRLGDILIYNLPYYIQHPLRIFAVWEGGMSFIGGIIGVVVSLLIMSYRYRFRLRDFFVMMDCLLIPVVFGIMIGRIGNFLNQELYGIVVPTTIWSWGYVVVSLLRDLHIFHVYPLVDDTIRVNTNFLSSFFEGFVLLVSFVGVCFRFYKKKTRSIGLISSLFLMMYSFVRFFLEYLRADSQLEYVYGLTKSQWFFVLFFGLGVVLFLFRKKILLFVDGKLSKQ